MEFLTLHELSLRFDVPVRVLRYRLRQLLPAGKLIEGQDYRRDEFVDDTHFVWKINPDTFMHVAGYQPVAKPATKAPPLVSQSVTTPPPPVTNHPPTGNETLPKVDTKLPAMEREMIDILKDQVRVKDGQIADLTGQSKTLTALNEKLTGAVVHQTEQIKKLLQLTGGKSELSELATKSGNEAEPVATEFATHGEQAAVNVANHAERKAA